MCNQISKFLNITLVTGVPIIALILFLGLVYKAYPLLHPLFTTVGENLGVEYVQSNHQIF